MTYLTSKQDLIDYAIRSLGGGVISIEVSPDQLEDRLEDALQYYQENHFDGIERDYVKHQITATSLTVASASGFVVNSSITNSTNATATITAINGNVITIGKTTGPADFRTGQTITDGTNTTTLTSVSLGTIDSGFIPVDEYVMGVIKVINLSSVLTSNDYMFSAQYQLMMNEIQNLTGAQTQYLYGVLNYMEHLNFILRKEKTFRFNRRTNKVFLDINWNTDVKVGDYLVLEVYKVLDVSLYEEILNDIWLKRYTTALIKKQWGNNTKKYNNVQLPGGIVFTGQQIFDEAVAEIKELEQEAIEKSAPLYFEVG